MIVRVLPDQVVNQIAAGEVVERPASVVKELVENSLDAGAHRIEVLLKAGGAERIRISDDGKGMDREDAMMCLERHATSKITATDDLETIASLGFRGEAIPSIASVSRFSILTRPHDVDEGVRVVVEGGQVKSAGAAGCAPGTEIDVRDLFFNLPARRKFLRTRATEYAHCLEAVARQALVRPEVAFRVTHDGRVALSADTTDLAGRTRQILGKDASQMVDVDFERDGIRVLGRVSPMSVHRPPGRSLYLFVNGRYVRDAVVRRAITDAYRDRLPRGRHPLVVLDIRMDPRQVDVNVHPAKTEVRFRNPRDTQAILSEGLRASIESQGMQRELSTPAPNQRPRWEQRVAPALPLRPVRAEKPVTPSIAAHPDDDPLMALTPKKLVDVVPSAIGQPSPVLEPGPSSSPVLPEPAPRPEQLMAAEPPLNTDSARRMRPIGPFGKRWYLCEDAEDLVVIDPVAGEAHLAALRVEQDGGAQRLLVPRRERLSEKQVRALLAQAEALAALGLEIVQMAPTELAIRTVPAVLPRLYLDGLLAKLAGASDLAQALALSQTPPETFDAIGIRSLLLSLEEAGLSCEVRRIPGRELVS